MTNEKNLKVLSLINDLILERFKDGSCSLVKDFKKVDLLDGFLNEPRNYITDKAYTGVNRALLPSGYYVSFTQAHEIGGKVKKGAKSYVAYAFFTTDYVRYKHKQESGEVVEKVATKESFEKHKTEDDEIVEEWQTFSSRYYRLFNINDCEGLPKYEREIVKTKPALAIPSDKLNPLAEYVIKLNVEQKQDHPTLQKNCDIKCSAYSPTKDRIYMKPFNEYKTSSDYYKNLFHELSHSTGKDTRLNREGITKADAKFGSEKYSIEELIAETTAMYCMQKLNLLTFEELDSSKEYLKSWYDHLQDPLKKDPRLLIKVFSQAEKSVNYIFSK